MLRILPVVLFLILSPPRLFSMPSGGLIPSESTTLNREANQIIALGKIIISHPESPLIDRIFSQREAIMQRLRSLRGIVEIGSREQPTFDISPLYDLTLQKYKLSCEIAAMRMVIESLTPIKISEEMIFSSLRIQDGPLSPEGILGDPDIGFVGSLTGSQRLRTGYGIYQKPLEKYGQSLGLHAVSSSIMSDDISRARIQLPLLLSALKEKKRIILWGDWCTSDSAEDGILPYVDSYIAKTLSLSAKNICDRIDEDRIITWKTLAGKEVNGLSGEHVFLLLGYLGNIENPTHIIVWDTDTGRHVFTYSEWMRKWGRMQYRTLEISLE